MKMFLHTQTRIRIINGEQEWTGTPADFQTLEPEYMGLPTLTQAPAVTRYQTPDWKYIEDSTGTKHPDTIDCLYYCDNIGTYVIDPPAIWVHCDLAKNLLCANAEAQDAIPYAIAMRTGPEPTDPIITQISSVWPIALRQKNGLAMDNILVSFVNGEASGNYTYYPGLPLGEWYIDELDFDTVPLGETIFVVKLAKPVRFTVFRS